MSKTLDKIKRDAVLGWHSLFHGMAGANSVIESPASSEGSEIVQQVSTGGVFADMLENKQTQRVIEMRDKYYRVLREADKYDASNISVTEKDIVNEDGNVETVLDFNISNGVRKKTKADFMKHSPVMEEEGTTLRTIQDNRHLLKHNIIHGANDAFDSSLLPTNMHDYYTTITVTREDDFTPRFEIDKYTTKMVVRNQDNTDRAMVDLYLPTIPGQFTKTDAVFISNIYSIMENKNMKSDITDLKTIEWYADRAWNAEDVSLFKYDDVKFVGISVFDGSFVATFDCHIVDDGTYLGEKYKTEELDKKYAEMAPKGDTVDMFAALRREEKLKARQNDIDIDNLSNTTLTLS